MKSWWNVLGLVGVGCSSLCFLALPLVALWLPLSRFGWLHDETLTRAMLLMFLAMSLMGTSAAFLAHRKSGPLLCAACGALLLTGTAWGRLSAAIGWLGLGALIAAWYWDRRLMQVEHHEHQEGRHG